ncbi:LytR/AlgR family response regulator transcription factor [Spirosoma endbachense]|uniref:Response regulator n=1 Tax=Spirosoma endbachense TaxID=2666025 RepID=A0A6P1W454_9BACT|nr:response regulator [Spirosoma endbachense]QHV99092.1 response regulator [Spirosoma endbachense]
MAPLSTVLIDDEPLALERLRRLLTEYRSILTISGEATNGWEGMALIESLRPAVIFLDIQMPQLTGFDMLARLTDPPYVVFTTAYDQYALRAFEEKSLDYLLKPIDAARLAKTVQKIQQSQSPTPLTLDTLRSLLVSHTLPPPMRAMTVKNGDSLELVVLDEIAFFQTAGKYVLLHTVDGKQHVVEYTLTELAERLPDQFVRISRASLVNRSLIRQLRKRLNGSYLLTLGDVKASKLETSTNSREIIARLQLL